MKLLYFIFILVTSGFLYGCNNVTFAFSMYQASLANQIELEKDFVIRIRRLPVEIQKKIYWQAMDLLKEENKKAIKAYAQEAIAVSIHKQTWYDIQHYFAFRNYGTDCIHIIALYPKKNTPHYHGIEQTSFGPVVTGSSACVFWHDLKENEVNTIDCIEKQEHAPCVYNGIQLSEKNPGRVYWFNPSSQHEAWIKEKKENCCIQ